MTNVSENDETKTCIRHLVRCRCILPQFKNHEDPPLHEFPVFSTGTVKKIDENEEGIDEKVELDVKYTQCPNCGIIHKVIDVCESIILSDKEYLSSIVTKEDLSFYLDEKIVEILEKYECDISKWEHSKYIIENEEWGSFIVLSSESDKSLGLRQGKYVKFLKKGLYSIEPFTREEIVSV